MHPGTLPSYILLEPGRGPLTFKTHVTSCHWHMRASFT